MSDEQELNQSPEERRDPTDGATGDSAAGARPDDGLGTVLGKSNPQDASDADAEAAMLAMMEGAEVGDGSGDNSGSSNFDEQLANLPEAERVAPGAIHYSDEIARPADFQQLSRDNEETSSRSIELLLDVSLPISIELGRTSMSINEILALGPGSVVELNKLAGEPVEVKVNNKTVALGEVVVVDENFGVRVTQLMSPEDRLKTLKN
ncbi:MAG TPA: flagellar motor switch protein FliN [candidate division Zixibacteria bacterium]|nr:flagellar motor switch protein FliN [candidate division Zixibacteria bacterium]